ncbi:MULTISPECIES: chorismate synthase [unclassified Haloferax]|uniref:chorismate synthase n=1 Tax=Haloferax TaxID=2251 RepID=UPI0002AF6A31|nr:MULTISPECIES: chorismate synthase [unclassified Haloferax]ELZ60161.1 chorismate synthase [Haloferax sp. ATCC BAA-646]ELZ64373.1 chorismate synthase [Haloferax sp. ATCC BAA-645]ELZ69792.1 chorismate synthase [Haloferax sp. ATCC BAA-644]
MNGNEFGRLFRMTTYGESHGDAMGVTISGCPAGVELSVEDVQAELDRRKPGQSMITTSRGEPDAVVVNSGVQDGYTTGTPIGMVVQNKDARSGKYEPYVTAPRPSHGDFTYSAKFGTRNWGGGGRSSARETVNWVAAGAVAKQVIEQSDHDIEIKAHVNQIGDVEAPEVSFDDLREHTEENDVRCAHPETAAEMQELIEEYQKEGDSIGGSIYFEAQGVPRGLGAPRFDSFSARLGQALMSVPAATAFEFGLGREAREWTGHDRNENWEFDESESQSDSEDASGDEPRAHGDPRPVGNNHGGIQGGITTGEPVYGELTLHAPTSIPKKQQTVDWETGEEKEIQVVGRHDPVLPPRGVPVVEAMLYVTVLDFMLLGGRINPDRLDGQAGEYDTPYHPSSPDNE